MKFSEYRKYIVPDVDDSGVEEEIDYSEIASWGLDKFMVPMDQMISRSLEVEGCQSYSPLFTFYGVDKNGKILKLDQNSNKFYSAEYSFDLPIRREYIEMNQNDLTDEIIKDWTSAIGNRVLPIIKHSISYDTVSKFDADPDVSCFFHIYSGKIDYFPTENINSFLIADYNISALNDLESIKDTKDLVQRLIRIYQCANQLLSSELSQITYYLSYHNTSTVLWEFFDTSLPREINRYWTTYMIEMMKRRAKVIVVP